VSIFDKTPRVYLASPFFNSPQKERVTAIEAILGRVKCDYFSPMSHGREIKPGDSPKVLDEVFTLDHSEIERCDFMVANLDYDLPTNVSSALIRVHPDLSVTVLKHLYMPDSGVIWELGAAYQYGKPIIGLKTVGSQLNLMLARSCLCVVRNLTDLEDVLKEFVPAVVSRSSNKYVSTIAILRAQYAWKESEAG